MARRRWSGSVLVALLASAGTAAAQFGLGYGLGIVAWTIPAGMAPGTIGDAAASSAAAVAGSADIAGTAAGAWSAGLTFTTWVAATSVVVGAVAGDRLAGRASNGRVLRGVWRLAAALSAALGGLVAVPLAAVPARHAQIVDTFAPHLLAAIYAVAGVVLGLIVSLIAVASRAIAANVAATTGWMWALAIAAAVDALVTGRGYGFGQLAVWEFTHGGPFWGSYYVPGTLLALGAALLVGGLASLPAAGRGEGRLGVAISGAAGPLIVAVAYLLADPRPDRVPEVQVSALQSSPYLVVAGLAGSLLVAAVGTVPARARSGPSAAAVMTGSTAPATVSATVSASAASRAMPGDGG